MQINTKTKFIFDYYDMVKCCSNDIFTVTTIFSTVMRSKSCWHILETITVKTSVGVILVI